MGRSYGNITFKGANQEAIAQAFSGRRAIIAPSVGEYTVAFDSACDDQNVDAIQALTSQVSATLGCVAFAVLIHDDDVFLYFLYRAGELVDSYNSCPDYFNAAFGAPPVGPTGGDAEALCQALGANHCEEVRLILRRERGRAGYVFETERHKALVTLLGLPGISIGNALASFERNDYPPGLSADQMRWAPNAPSKAEDRQSRRDGKTQEVPGPKEASTKCKYPGCDEDVPRVGLCERHRAEITARILAEMQKQKPTT
jgi:hypothetical protein